MKKLLTAMGLGKLGTGGKTPTTVFPVECDDGDKDILGQVLDAHPTMVSHERLFATMMACKHVCEAGVQGDFVECGVWRGGNAIVAADIFRRSGQPRTSWLFDTFTGMTEPTEADVKHSGEGARASFLRKQRMGYNEWCYASIEDVQESFS